MATAKRRSLQIGKRKRPAQVRHGAMQKDEAKPAAKLKSRDQPREESGLQVLTLHGRKKGTVRRGLFGTIYHAPSLDKVALIKAGVAPEAVDDIAQAMGARQEMVIRNLGIAKSTWARKRQQHAPLEKNASELVVGLAALIGQVEALVDEQGNPEGFDAARWFHKWVEDPVPALDGKKPSELLDTKEGQQIVSGLLAAIRAGTYL